MTNIALVGPPGSGKSTIGDNLGGMRLSFAASLKGEVHQGLMYQGPRTPEEKEILRPLYQAWGTVRRDIWGEDYFVDKIKRSIAILPGPFVIDDCRYPNEYDMLRERGFVFIRLAPGPTSFAVPDHPSEWHWPKFAVDLELSYEPGPAHQADRIREWLSTRPSASI